jgi:DNA polymerase III epsilon subunit-like protein
MNTEFDRLVVIDFETTGTSRNKRAVEIAWFELNKNFEIIDEQNSLINPMIPIPAEVIAIHKITDDMVKNSPTLD